MARKHCLDKGLCGCYGLRAGYPCVIPDMLLTGRGVKAHGTVCLCVVCPWAQQLQPRRCGYVVLRSIYVRRCGHADLPLLSDPLFKVKLCVASEQQRRARARSTTSPLSGRFLARLHAPRLGTPYRMGAVRPGGAVAAGQRDKHAGKPRRRARRATRRGGGRVAWQQRCRAAAEAEPDGELMARRRARKGFSKKKKQRRARPSATPLPTFLAPCLLAPSGPARLILALLGWGGERPGEGQGKVIIVERGSEPGLEASLRPARE
jgi:hypothetical protein